MLINRLLDLLRQERYTLVKGTRFVKSCFFLTMSSEHAEEESSGTSVSTVETEASHDKNAEEKERRSWLDVRP